MKRLSELQYFSRMQRQDPELGQPDVTPGDMSNDEDIFGAYAEPADVTPGDTSDLDYFEDTYFEEPADVTYGDMGMYESREGVDDELEAAKQRMINWTVQLIRKGDYRNEEDVREMVEFRYPNSSDTILDEVVTEAFDIVERGDNIPITEANPFRRKLKREAIEGNVDTVDYKGYTITVHRNRGGMYTAKNDSGEPYNNVPQFKTAEEAIAWDKKNIDQMEESSLSSGTRLREATIDPRELMDPESEYYLGDENDEVMPDLDSIGGIRNPDNPYVDMENTLGKDTADFMRRYNNSPKQRMHKYLFDTHEWSEDDDQSDWDEKIEYFYGDLHDKFGNEEDWDDETARNVARTHMYGHPRWDEKAYGFELKKALELYETAQQTMQLFSRIRETKAYDTPMKVRNFLVKNLDGKAAPNFGSNPYANVQRLEVALPKTAMKQLPDALASIGFVEGDDSIKSYYQDGVDVYVSNTNPDLKVVFDINDKHRVVGIVGPKKAKRSTLPYYDSKETSEPRLTEQRLSEITGASWAREYLSQLDDPTDASYEDYAAWLEDQGAPEQLISKVWFKTNKKRHLANRDEKPLKRPKSIPPIEKEEPNRDLKRPVSIPPLRNRQFDVTDQKRVEDIIRRAGYRLETMWGEDHAVSLRQTKNRDGSPLSILDAYIETGDRGPRMDHGGESGDGWMGSAEIEREFSPYGKKWAPRAKALEEKLQAEGYPNAKVSVDYGEKGHIGLSVWITSDSPTRKTESKVLRESSTQQLYSIWVRHNFNRSGSTYDYSARRLPFPVLASSEEEALNIARQHKDEVENELRKRRMHNGRLLIMKSDTYRLEDRDIFRAEPSKTNWRNPEAVQVLTRDGFDIVDLSDLEDGVERQVESTGAGFGPMGSPARGSAEDDIDRNELGWERHPYEDDWGEEDDDDVPLEWDDEDDDRNIVTGEDEDPFF